MSKSKISIPKDQLRWKNDVLKVPDGYKWPVWEGEEESYQVLPLKVVSSGVQSIVWLHIIGRRKWNQFEQRNWSKAWTTDAKEGGNYVNVSKLTTWLSSFIGDGNNSKSKSVTNNHIIEQGPYKQKSRFPGFTPYKLCFKAWCKGPDIRGPENCIG